MAQVILLAVIAAMMAAEAHVSRRNERRLRARGAIEPPGDPHRWMRIVYPVGFVLMAVEGLLRNEASAEQVLSGAALFALAKGLKYWAIVTLGPFWSFRVLVVPGAPLVHRGPYRWVRHPNYAAVAGELVGAAMLLNAPLFGSATTLAFAAFLWRRIGIEERALGLDRGSRESA
jgi:methyltransferase